MGRWEDVTETFGESQRHYKDTYLEIDEVYEGCVEVSLFSAKDREWEIYFSFEEIYGIVYAGADEAPKIREEMKKELAEEYDKNKYPSSEFVNRFGEKYKVEIPADTFFDFSIEDFL